jgi:hypothetical protein
MIQMSHRFTEATARAGNGANGNGTGGNDDRIEYAKQMLEEMAVHVTRTRQNGTIGIEIPVKDGKLGKVKRLSITFQRE